MMKQYLDWNINYHKILSYFTIYCLIIFYDRGNSNDWWFHLMINYCNKLYDSLLIDYLIFRILSWLISLPHIQDSLLDRLRYYLIFRILSWLITSYSGISPSLLPHIQGSLLDLLPHVKDSLLDWLPHIQDSLLDWLPRIQDSHLIA